MSNSPIFLCRYHPTIIKSITNSLNNAHAFTHNLFLDFHLFLNLNPKVDCPLNFAKDPLELFSHKIISNNIIPCDLQHTQQMHYDFPIY